MATIDNLDLGVYFLYARRTQMLEQINKEFHLTEASSIPSHTQVVDLYPKLSELDILLGVARAHAPWALFLPPKKFRNQRRSRFAFSRITPAFGDDDELDEAIETIAKTPVKTKKEAGERQALISVMKQIEQINDWLGDIIGRMGQFLQG